MSWSDLWPPIAVTIFAWWFSTGVVLLLVRLKPSLHWPVLIGFAGIAGLAVWGLIVSAKNESAASAYCGFLSALMIWGWHEASFLMGKVTGPRPKPCPEGVSGVKRFGYATATLIYHEVALFVTLLGLSALMWSAPNQTGLWTFALLFALRLSAKFNIFLGVPNLTDEFFPAHLEHLKSYLPKRAMNWLMPLSLITSAVMIFWLWRGLAEDTVGPGATAGHIILITLLALGMLEHIFMITPLPDAALWRWAAPVQRSPLAPKEAPPQTNARVLEKPENA
jgi:putative photosynthetic complex assembly protein 2